MRNQEELNKAIDDFHITITAEQLVSEYQALDPHDAVKIHDLDEWALDNVLYSVSDQVFDNPRTEYVISGVTNQDRVVSKTVDAGLSSEEFFDALNNVIDNLQAK